MTQCGGVPLSPQILRIQRGTDSGDEGSESAESNAADAAADDLSAVGHGVTATAWLGYGPSAPSPHCRDGATRGSSPRGVLTASLWSPRTGSRDKGRRSTRSALLLEEGLGHSYTPSHSALGSPPFFGGKLSRRASSYLSKWGGSMGGTKRRWAKLRATSPWARRLSFSRSRSLISP